jgi:hypothetical protein
MDCKELATAEVCFTNGAVKTSLVAHYEYRQNAAGNTVLYATRYTDAAGVAVDTSAGTVAVGACAVAAPDVEFIKLCDVSAAGVVTEFYRRVNTTFDANGAPTSVAADVQLDMVTAYAPTGTVGDCANQCDVTAPVGLVTTWG